MEKETYLRGRIAFIEVAICPHNISVHQWTVCSVCKDQSGSVCIKLPLATTSTFCKESIKAPAADARYHSRSRCAMHSMDGFSALVVRVMPAPKGVCVHPALFYSEAINGSHQEVRGCTDRFRFIGIPDLSASKDCRLWVVVV